MEITGTKQRFEGGAPLLWNLDRRPAFGSDGSERTENRYNGYGADALAGTSATRINPETGNVCSDRMQVHADMEAITRVLIEHQRGNGLNVTDQLVLTQGRTALLPGETYLPAQGNRQNTPEGAEDPAWVDLVAQYARKADLESMTAEFGMSHMLPWTQTFEADARPEIPANVEKVWLKEPDEEVSGRPSVYGPLTTSRPRRRSPASSTAGATSSRSTCTERRSRTSTSSTRGTAAWSSSVKPSRSSSTATTRATPSGPSSPAW